MNYIFSFFTGAGLWDYALAKKFQIIRTNEFNKSFYDGYNGFPILGNFNFDFNEILINNSLYKLLVNEVNHYKKSGYVGFVGGTPCIDFSIAGQNQGKNGIHGKLFGLFIDLIHNIKPDFFIIENVDNLIHQHFDYFMQEYVKLNFNFTCNYVKLNALEFGVPQNRKRIFIYGVSKKIKKELSQNINDFKIYNLENIKKKSWPKTNDFGLHIEKPKNIIYELTPDYWWQGIESHPNQSNFYTRSNDIDITLKEGEIRSQRQSRFHRYRYANTLCFGNGRNIPSHPTILRSISVAEALAIQSMPKAFSLPQKMSIVNMYRVIANGVPYKLGYAIGGLINKELL